MKVIFLDHDGVICLSTEWGGIVGSTNDFGAAYCTTTSAITGFRVNFSSGNIDAGTVKLYGIKDS